MATVVHLVEKTATNGENDIRDGIRAVIVAIDDLVDTTAALIQARAVTVAVANGIDLPVGYFDSNRLITGTWDAVDDITVFTGKNTGKVEVIA